MASLTSLARGRPALGILILMASPVAGVAAHAGGALLDLEECRGR